jgi:hypothetical protein
MPDDDDLDTEPGAHRPPGAGVGHWVRGGSDQPGPFGFDDAQPMQAITRTVTAVTKDWVPPNPSGTPAIRVTGKTLARVFEQLNAAGRWGVGGGFARNDPVPKGSNPNVTVVLHGNLVLRLPVWTEYANASTAAKAEWDRMFAALRRHEQRHVDIAIEELDSLATGLQGADVTQIAGLVTQANAEMNRRQRQLDKDTADGTKPGVQYGDISLDTSIA